MLKLIDIKYRHANTIFNFSFTAKKGEKIIVIGPSGSGKTTLLNLISGFFQPIQGKIFINNYDYTKIYSNQRPVSMLFQENNLFMHLTVYENIGLALNSRLKLNDLEKKKIKKIAEKMKIIDLMQFFPYQLSGGQQQRVALSRCLLQKRPVLLLDEPFSSLDFFLRQEIIKLIDTICNEYNITLLNITHHLDDFKNLSLRSILIDKGKIVFDGLINQAIKKFENFYK
ncbi:thiamine ABC transporter ATP-binding protein [Candidatus Tachikawaea gelatinosa]|uniref:Thiamine import ATP-binding protein ThiQ n=1 Tax=Candidatus Tachikawaea gelatinosa TaxID=1410383 RepID=A0A090AQX0_9ENTR|nr:thiamine ABC transporter ATP-binding protein [Candidatus Tachikawaea gelatinosa]BAP58747.1 thiamine import ATP-binding protein ThiQ [Candidatus Tachikawaea gelatinosa]